jgi:phosphoglucomutase
MPVGYTPVELDGQVVKHPAAVGSKSERQGLFLETESGSYVLRRSGGNPMFDPEMEKLVGKTIHCKGVLTEHTLIISHWDEVGHQPSEKSK